MALEPVVINRIRGLRNINPAYNMTHDELIKFVVDTITEMNQFGKITLYTFLNGDYSEVIRGDHLTINMNNIIARLNKCAKLIGTHVGEYPDWYDDMTPTTEVVYKLFKKHRIPVTVILGHCGCTVDSNNGMLMRYDDSKRIGIIRIDMNMRHADYINEDVFCNDNDMMWRIAHYHTYENDESIKHISVVFTVLEDYESNPYFFYAPDGIPTFNYMRYVKLFNSLSSKVNTAKDFNYNEWAKKYPHRSEIIYICREYCIPITEDMLSLDDTFEKGLNITIPDYI